MIYSDLEAEAIIEAVINDKGYSWYDAYNRKRNRRRLQIDKANRPDRKPLSKSEREKLFNRQKGICPWCDNALDIPAYKNKGDDHVNPNLEGDAYNALRNRQLLHEKCNLEKAAKTLEEQSKHTGKTMKELLDVPHGEAT